MSKCICKKCEECRLYRSWDMVGDGGIRKQIFRCDIHVIAETLPKLIGSVDGCQAAANETRNRVLEYANAATEAIMSMPNFVKRVIVEQADVDTNPEQVQVQEIES